MIHDCIRDCIVFPTVPLAFIKELKAAANVTVNDILMTAVSQAIHDYCQSQNDLILASKQASAIQCRALLPAGFPRSPEELEDPVMAMRNKWCMVSCDIGLGCNDIMDRLAFVRIKTTAMKEKPRALRLKIQNAISPLLPTSVARQTVMDVFSRHSLVLTNVPGPDQTCLFTGSPVRGVQLFFNNILPQVDLLSYAGQVYGNIVYDPEALVGFEDFGRNYARALLQLAKRLKVQPPKQLVSAAEGRA